MKFKNTLQKGSVRYIVFREGKTWHAVALEFNIVESGDDKREVLFSLSEAIRGYVASARKMKARPNILNQETDKEYEVLWDKVNGIRTTQKKVGFPEVYTFGQVELAAA